MGLVHKHITLTDQQEAWLREQVEQGRYTDESAALRDLIRKEQERQGELGELRRALLEGERSGVSTKTADEILAGAREKLRDGSVSTH